MLWFTAAFELVLANIGELHFGQCTSMTFTW